MKTIEFLKELPSRVDPKAVEGHNTVFHFDLDGEEGGGVTLKIVDGLVTAEDGLVGEPKCIVKAKSDNLMRVLKGDLNPMMALLTGKLGISNQGEMLKYAKIFGLM